MLLGYITGGFSLLGVKEESTNEEKNRARGKAIQENSLASVASTHFTIKRRAKAILADVHRRVPSKEEGVKGCS
jgi:hypothetical protein